jgi:hypothetical protein
MDRPGSRGVRPADGGDGRSFVFWNNRETPGSSAAGSSSLFTVESSVSAVAAPLYNASRHDDERASSTYDLVRAAAVLLMTTTSVVYRVLLFGYATDLGTAVRWAANVVHGLMPVALVADRLVDTTADAPDDAPGVGQDRVSPGIPDLFVGAETADGLIPYPFLDPDKAGGYGVFACGAGNTVFVLLIT